MQTVHAEIDALVHQAEVEAGRQRMTPHAAKDWFRARGRDGVADRLQMLWVEAASLSQLSQSRGPRAA